MPRIADLGFDWIYLNPFHQTGGSKSLYAVADTDHLDERLRDQDGTPDDEQIRRFCAAARAAGISVMTDLVINHTADNARLVQERPDLSCASPTARSCTRPPSIPTTRRSAPSGATSPNSTITAPPPGRR